MRRLAVLLVPALVLALAAVARAEGVSLTTAVSVAYGQQEFGNTINARKWENENCNEGKRQEYEAYWSLGVVAGDVITIDWEATQPQTKLEIFPLGTTDFNFGKTSPVQMQGLNSNGKNELIFTNNIAAGSMPMIIHNASCEGTNGPGPYSFTAFVIHALNVGLPHVLTLSGRGTLTVGVRSPEGMLITSPAVQIALQIKGRGSWQTIGVGSAATPVIAYKIPARYRRTRHVTLRALAHGNGYSSASSAHVKVRTL